MYNSFNIYCRHNQRLGSLGLVTDDDDDDALNLVFSVWLQMICYDDAIWLMSNFLQVSIWFKYQSHHVLLHSLKNLMQYKENIIYAFANHPWTCTWLYVTKVELTSGKLLESLEQFPEYDVELHFEFYFLTMIISILK